MGFRVGLASCSQSVRHMTREGSAEKTRWSTQVVVDRMRGDITPTSTCAALQLPRGLRGKMLSRRVRTKYYDMQIERGFSASR